MEVELEHRFGPENVQTFAALSGDDNPIHLDHAYATKQVHTVAWHGCDCSIFGGFDTSQPSPPSNTRPPITTIDQGIFKGAIVHGLLVGSLFGTIFGVTFPGCVYLSQSFKVGWLVGWLGCGAGLVVGA